MAVKRSRLIAVVFSAAVALIASLAAIVFTSDIGTLLYLIGIAILSTLLLGIAIALRRGREQRLTSVAAFGAFLIVTVGVLNSQQQIRPHFLWLVWSDRYKSEVLANPAVANGEFKHMEWDGDGWGSGATGDWMGYVVFDPSDSLSAARKKNVPTECGYSVQGHIGAAFGETVVLHSARHEPVLGQNASGLPMREYFRH